MKLRKSTKKKLSPGRDAKRAPPEHESIPLPPRQPVLSHRSMFYWTVTHLLSPYNATATHQTGGATSTVTTNWINNKTPFRQSFMILSLMLIWRFLLTIIMQFLYTQKIKKITAIWHKTNRSNYRLIMYLILQRPFRKENNYPDSWVSVHILWLLESRYATWKQRIYWERATLYKGSRPPTKQP